MRYLSKTQTLVAVVVRYLGRDCVVNDWIGEVPHFVSFRHAGKKGRSYVDKIKVGEYNRTGKNAGEDNNGW